MRLQIILGCVPALWASERSYITMTLSAAKKVPLLFKHSNISHYFSFVFYLMSKPTASKVQALMVTTGSKGVSQLARQSC